MKWAAATMLLMAAAARGDVLRLMDGTVLEGTIKHGDGGWVVTAGDGSVTVVPSEKVKSFELSRKTGETAAADALGSLRRSVENQTDLKGIVEKYQRYVESHPGTQSVEEAKKDLELWQERLKQGMVKVGTKWVTAVQRMEMHKAGQAIAARAMEAMKAGKTPEAADLVDQVIAADPLNATAIYLRAILEIGSGKWESARQSFEAVNALAPNNGAVLNNLAVVAVKQKRMAIAMNYFDEAMQATPMNRTVVDNAAEALHALSDRELQGDSAQLAAKRFEEQEQRLEAAMAKEGYLRWGAVWVKSEEMPRLSAAQKEIDAKLGAIQGEFDHVQGLIAAVDQQTAENNSNLDQTSLDYFTPGPGGVPREVLPTTAYRGALAQGNSDLQTTRTQLTAKEAALRKEAKSVSEQLPVAKYTGMQRLIGAEGAPGELPD